MRWGRTIGVGVLAAALVVLSHRWGAAEWGIPPRPVRFVSFNIFHAYRGVDAVTGAIREKVGDFVFLQEVEGKDWDAIKHALGMDGVFQVQVTYPGVGPDGRPNTEGNAILSLHALSNARPLNDAAGKNFGVICDATVDGRRFVVATVHLTATRSLWPGALRESVASRQGQVKALIKAWEERGSPPIVVGGDFNQEPSGGAYEEMTRLWTDVMKSLGKDSHTCEYELGAGLTLKTRIDYFLVSREWRATMGDVPRTSASDHFPILMDAVSAADTHPSSPSSR